MKIGCIALVFHKGQIIAIECAKGRGTIMPGGKWEAGETFMAAAKREFNEETGMKVCNLQYMFGGPDGAGYFCYTFLGTLDGDFKENVTREGRVKLTTWKELKTSTFGAYYEILEQIDHESDRVRAAEYSGG